MTLEYRVLSFLMLALMLVSCSPKLIKKEEAPIKLENEISSRVLANNDTSDETKKSNSPLNLKLKNTIESKNISHYYGLSTNDGLLVRSAYNGFKNFQFEAWFNTGSINNTTLDIGANLNISDYLVFETSFVNLVDNITLTNNADTKKLKKYDLSIGADLLKFYGKVDTRLNNEVENVTVGIKGPLSIFKK